MSVDDSDFLNHVNSSLWSLTMALRLIQTDCQQIRRSCYIIRYMEYRKCGGLSKDMIIRTKNLSTLPSRHCMEDMASSLYHLMIELAGKPIQVKQVDFNHEAGPILDEYVSVFGIMPRFGEKMNARNRAPFRAHLRGGWGFAKAVPALPEGGIAADAAWLMGLA
ncbi:hypothetical protein D3C72_1474860 [compost metagenome]